MKNKKVYVLLFFLILISIFLLMFIYFKFLKYPFNYKQEILQYSNQYNLEPEFVASVIYAESKYNKNAVSSVGAIGLMQIMPSTAIEISEKLNIDNFKIDDLYNPKINIMFGCYYLNYLINMFEDKKVALCAYNAGLNNVKLWLNNSEYSTDSKTLFKIPFSETNNYVNKIFKAVNHYKNLFN